MRLCAGPPRTPPGAAAPRYHDLAGDPCRLTNLLYRATPAEEQALGIPALADRLHADRTA
ncbi:hypothetical protein IPZ70_24065 [Streptomyces polychromogenes]|nr:hypothetical protein [Streptomyces polychromogenes]